MHLYSIALGWYRRTVVTLVRAFAGARWRSPQGAGTFAIRLVHIIKLAVRHGNRGGQGILHIQDSKFKILHLPPAAVAGARREECAPSPVARAPLRGLPVQQAAHKFHYFAGLGVGEDEYFAIPKSS